MNFPVHLAMQDSKNIARVSKPENILEEVREIVLLMFPEFDFTEVTRGYHDIVKLFQGDFPGYQKCNIKYHDLRHTEDCFLLMARLIHGASQNGCQFTERSVNLGLLSAIMHDSGYIQSEDDFIGTGGKFTIIHIERSILFVKKYFELNGYPVKDFRFVINCLECTGLQVSIKDIKFESLENELMGKILGTADLIGQMADTNYLEKLPYLFEEFREAGIKDYKNELELLQKTPAFWEFTKQRLASELGNVDRYLRDHFRVRWGIDKDLDREAIENNILRLRYILKYHRDDYRRYLRI